MEKKIFINKINNILKEKTKIKNIINNFIKKKKYVEYNNINKKYLIIKNILFYFNKYNNIEKEIKTIEKIENKKEIFILIKEELDKLNLLLENNKFIIEKLIYKYENIYLGCYLEIKLGTGGTESSYFLNDLYKMYIKYINIKKWDYKIISETINKNIIKEIIIKIKNYESYNLLKYESGGHRVQRIPYNETQGRIHTSTCTVSVTPILYSNEIIIKNKDLKIDTFKSSGAGGQHVNKTDSAVRVKHIPTNISIECQSERSQHKNKSRAISILKSKILFIKKKEIDYNVNIIKKKLSGTGIRNDRIRTYNFIQNRITDHKFLISIYSLDKILNGYLDILINKIFKIKNIF